MKQELVIMFLFLIMIGGLGCSNNEDPVIVNKPSSENLGHASSLSPTSVPQHNPSSSSSRSEPPSVDELVNISVCIYYAKDEINNEGNECNCLHCIAGKLSISMTGVGVNQVYQLNTSDTPRSLILGGTRTLTRFTHPTHGSLQTDYHYPGDIPGNEYTGGDFDSNGVFKLNTNLSEENCYIGNSNDANCAGVTYKTDSILYSVIGSVDGRYFYQSAQQLKIGTEATIRRDSITLHDIPFHFGNWCEIIVGRRNH